MDIKFETDNAAFEDEPSIEVARILRHIANQVEEGYVEGQILDINGNAAGWWTL